MRRAPPGLLKRIPIPTPFSLGPSKKADPLHFRDHVLFRKLPKGRNSEPTIPTAIFEARLRARVDIQPFTSVRGDDIERYSERPRGRSVPFGMDRANHRVRSVSLTAASVTAMPIPTHRKREKPRFRSPVQIQELETSFTSLPSEMASTSSLLPNDKRPQLSQRLKPSFRRKSSSSALALSETPESAILDHNNESKRSTRHSDGIRVSSQVPLRDAASQYTSDQIESGCIPRNPDNKGDLVGILRKSAQVHTDHRTLRRLLAYHQKHHDLATTASYNILLQLAFTLRDLSIFNALLKTMTTLHIPRDAITWDLSMTTWAGNARWDKLVDEFEERQQAGVPLSSIGWTRLLQAATRNGTTTFAEEEARDTISPIYNAVFSLPRGVKQSHLRKMVESPRMDVDQLLGAMMPSDMHPLDFQATLVMGHRLAKQRRWREADDIAALWLDTLARGSVNSAQDDGSPDGEKMKRTLSQRCLSLCHVVLEGLILNRSTPEMVEAYLDNFLERYAHFNPKPTYHTLFLYLTSFRILPIGIAFMAAAKGFNDFQEKHNLQAKTPGSRYGDSRCRRQLQQYGLWSYRRAYRLTAVRKAVQNKLKELQLDPIFNGDESEAIPVDDDERVPPQHMLQKEKLRHQQFRQSLDKMQSGRRMRNTERPFNLLDSSDDKQRTKYMKVP